VIVDVWLEPDAFARILDDIAINLQMGNDRDARDLLRGLHEWLGGAVKPWTRSHLRLDTRIEDGGKAVIQITLD
jgi:hypothetical protein